MSMERTLVIIKPDAVARRLMGKILCRFEEKGLIVAAMRMMMVTPEIAKKHYAEHEGKPFYEGLVKFITSGPVVVMAVEGVEAIAVVRKMVGATNGRAAEPGSIRGDFGMSKGFNMIHASDSAPSAERELALYFAAGDYMPEAKQESLRWNYEFGPGGAV